MSCGIGRRHGLDPTLLWLWCRPGAATPIQPLAWESPYTGVQPEERKEGRKEGRKEERAIDYLNGSEKVSAMLLPTFTDGLSLT